MYFTVDRFEEGFAVLESVEREIFSVPRDLLPADCGEGAVLQRTEDGRFIHAKEKETERAARIQEKMKGLWV